MAKFEFIPSVLSIFRKHAIIAFAFAIFGISAIFNKGFYQPDEHYQIVEFAELKNGNNQPGDMAWEYGAKIRPAIQPAIFYVLLNGLRWIHITDQYAITVFTRLIVSLISLVIITMFINATESLVEPSFKTAYQLLSYFLCFVPFISVRFSSENFSALSFLLGLCLTYKPVTKHTWYLLGICLGLSFLFRFQTAFMSLGLLLWLAIVQKLNVYDLIKVFMGALLIVYTGTLIDYWFYGMFTFTFINYFTANVINGVASSFGIFPWYYYVTILVTNCSFPLAFGLIATILVLSFFEPKNLLIWIIVPFLFIHSITPHKELRFLFPIGNLIPLVIISSVQLLIGRNLLNRNILRFITALFVIVNAIGLMTTIFSPADEEGRISITQCIHENYSGKDVVLYYLSYLNPYKPITPNQRFYLDQNVTQQELLPDRSTVNINENVTRLLVVQKKAISQNKSLLRPLKLKYISSGEPLWIGRLKHFIQFRDEGNSLELFEIQEKNFNPIQ